ncbi:hypothetical protein JW979_08510 [bacterium]|nr:hypothetical protein [candidate division CSSED10-310 bacterium]
MKLKMLLVILIILTAGLNSLAEDHMLQQTGYAVVLTNGTKIGVSEYFIDLDHETITYKSISSGMTATFPLERLRKVVRFNGLIEELPEDAHILYENTASIASVPDDGGIPIMFKVKAVTVGMSSGGYSSRSSTSSSRGIAGTQSRSTSSRSSSSAYTSSSRSFGSTAATSRTSSNTGRSSTSSTSTDAEEFFKKVFGGR